MGVKHLWSIIDEAKSKETLECMRGKIVSVDLSIWIVEAIKTLQFKSGIKKPHLRNIFYRILNLRRLGVKLIFVTEGEAPDLKQETMKQRNVQRYGVKSNTKKKVGRSRFQRTINECCKMLDLLGVPYVQAKGEAEAMCAEMSACALADGCLTNDGDFLLYGGKLIYRDFGIDPKDPHVFVYKMEDIEKICGKTRNDLIGIGLIAGCDYCEGVPGVGKITLEKFLAESKEFDEDILARVKSWKDGKESSNSIGKHERTIIKKSAGRMNSIYNQAIVNEYLISKDDMSNIQKKFKWRYPDVKGIQDFLLEHLEWPEEYTLSKVLQLSTSTYLEKLSDGTSIPVPISPKRVVKSRCQQGVSLVEIEWRKQSMDIYTRKWTAVPCEFSTLENQEVVTKVIPDLVQTFLDGKSKKKKTAKPKGVDVSTENNIDESSASHEIDIALDKISLIQRNKISPSDTGRAEYNVTICANAPLVNYPVITSQNDGLIRDVKCIDVNDKRQPSFECEDDLAEEDDGYLPLSQRIRLKKEKRKIPLDVLPVDAQLKINTSVVSSSIVPQTSSSKYASVVNKNDDKQLQDVIESPKILDDVTNRISTIQLSDSILCDSFDNLTLSESPCVIDVKKSYENKLRTQFVPRSPVIPKIENNDVIPETCITNDEISRSPLSLRERLKLYR